MLCFYLFMSTVITAMAIISTAKRTAAITPTIKPTFVPDAEKAMTKKLNLSN